MIQYEVEEINLLLQYLSTKPYSEVFQLIEMIQNGKVKEGVPSDE